MALLYGTLQQEDILACSSAVPALAASSTSPEAAAAPCSLVPRLSGPPRRNRRRTRTMFEGAALEFLEASFVQEPYPDIHQREAIAEALAVPEARIHTWFQNKRSRTKRDLKAPAPVCSSPEQQPASHGSPSPDHHQPSSASSPESPVSPVLITPEPVTTSASPSPVSSVPAGVRRPWEDSPSPRSAKRPRLESHSSPDSGVLDLSRKSSPGGPGVPSPLDLAIKPPAHGVLNLGPVPPQLAYSPADKCYLLLPPASLSPYLPLMPPSPGALTPLLLSPPSATALTSPRDLMTALNISGAQARPRHFIFPPFPYTS